MRFFKTIFFYKISMQDSSKLAPLRGKEIKL